MARTLIEDFKLENPQYKDVDDGVFKSAIISDFKSQFPQYKDMGDDFFAPMLNPTEKTTMEKAAKAATDVTNKWWSYFENFNPDDLGSVEGVIGTAKAPFTTKSIDTPDTQRVVKDVVGGAAGTASGMLATIPATMKRLGISDEGENAPFEETAQRLDDFAKRMQPENPNFGDSLASGLASMATFFFPGSGAAAVVGQMPRLGAWAAKLAPLTGVAVSTIMESGTEAGQTYLDAKKEFGDIEAAHMAQNTFLGNVALVGLTNYLGGMFDPRIKGMVRRAFTQATTEGFQEGGQSIIQKVAQGKPIDWGDFWTSVGVGSLTGGGVGLVQESFLDERTLDPETASVARERIPEVVDAFRAQPIPKPKEAVDTAVLSAVIAKQRAVERGADPAAAAVDSLHAFTKTLDPEPLVPQKKKAKGIIEYIKGWGGVDSTKEGGADFAELEIKGLVNDKNGKAPDHLVEKAIEDGFLPEQSTYNDLLALVEREQYSGPVLRQGDEAEGAIPERPLDSMSIESLDREIDRFQDMLGQGKAGKSIQLRLADLLEARKRRAQAEAEDMPDWVTEPLEGLEPTASPSPDFIVGEKINGKEPWQMTKAEYRAAWDTPEFRAKFPNYKGDQDHGAQVADAVDTGKPVPPEVLADYPDLQSYVEKQKPTPGQMQGDAELARLARANQVEDDLIVSLVDQIERDDAIIAEDYEGKFDAGEGEVRGVIRHTPGGQFKAIIELASGATRKTARHEFMHFARKNLLDQKQVSVLEDAFQGNQEDEADAFGLYMAEGSAGNSLVDKVFKVLKDFVGRMGNWMKGRGFQTVEDIFKAIDQGKLGKRKGEAKKSVKPQFSVEQTKTPAFKKWFGDSKVVDESGKPLVVYHGTTHKFDAFNTERGNIENHYGKAFYFTDSKTDVEENYAGEGPDLTQRISLRAERIFQDMFSDNEEPKYKTPAYEKAMEKATAAARKELAGKQSRTIEAYLSLQNPVILAGDNQTRFEINFDEESGEESGNGIDLYNAMLRTAPQFDVDGQEIWGDVTSKLEPSDFSAKEFEDAMRESEKVAYIENPETGDLASNEFIKELWKEAGFDGIIMDADTAFGGKRKIGKSMAMDEGTKHYIAFEPTQIKSATGNRGTFSPKDPRIQYSVERRAPTFFSAAEKLIEEKMPNSAPVSQVRAILSTAKQEEVKWLGVEQFLEGKEKVSKAEMLDFVRANQVKVEEVVKGGGKDEPRKLTYDEAKALSAKGKDIYDERGAKFSPDKFHLASPDIQFYERAGKTKFQNYQLPGGENYRELLLTLPAKEVVKRTEGRIEQLDNGKFLLSVPGLQVELFDTRAAAEAKQAEITDRVGQVTKDENFRSSHFDEPNILAHVRFNERTGPQGERILFLEEVQSDWGQANRKELDEITKPFGVREQAENVLGRKFPSLMPLEVVDGGVLATLQNDQIRDAVIANLPVNVVNSLASSQFTPEEIFSKPDMIFSRLAVNHRLTVAQGILNSARKIGADLRAKLSGGLSAGRDVELLPTLKASDLTPREVVGMLSPKSIYHVSLLGSPGKSDVTGTGTELSSPSNAGRINPDTLTASTALGEKSEFPAGHRAESGLRPAGSDQKLFTASPTDILDWHTKIVSQAGTSKQTRYVPGPFVGKTESWMALSMKRILRYAAENGFDQLAWTTGEQQADRYDLSKQVRSIGWTGPRAPGSTKTVTIYPLGSFNDIEFKLTPDGKVKAIGEGTIGNEIHGKNIDEVVGKDAAKQIMAEPYGELSGDGLKVGGQGMRGFYDQIIPSFLNKYAKKWGGRVGQIEIDAGNTETAILSQDNDGLWIVTIGNETEYFGRNRDSAYRYAKKVNSAKTSVATTVHSLDITPSMKRDVLEVGQVQFSVERKDEPQVGQAIKAISDSIKANEVGGDYTLGDGETIKAEDLVDSMTLKEVVGEKASSFLKAVKKGIHFLELPQNYLYAHEDSKPVAEGVIDAFVARERREHDIEEFKRVALSAPNPEALAEIVAAADRDNDVNIFAELTKAVKAGKITQADKEAFTKGLYFIHKAAKDQLIRDILASRVGVRIKSMGSRYFVTYETKDGKVQERWLTRTQMKALEARGTKITVLEEKEQIRIKRGSPEKGEVIESTRKVSSYDEALSMLKEEEKQLIRELLPYRNYIPHARRGGKFWVEAYDQEGQKVYSARVPNEPVAAKMKALIQKEQPDWRVDVHPHSEKMRIVPSFGSMADVQFFMNQNGIDPQSEPAQRIINAYRSVSPLMASLIHSQNIAGYKVDWDSIVDSMALMASSGSGRAYRLDVKDLMDDVKNIKDDFRFNAALQYVNALSEIQEDMPVVLQSIKSLTYFWLLANKSTYVIQNLTEPIWALARIESIKNPAGFAIVLNDEYKALLNRATEEGILKPFFSEQALAMNPLENLQKLDILGRASEVWSSRKVFEIGLRLARDNGLRGNEAYRYAYQFLFNKGKPFYSTANKPIGMLGKGWAVNRQYGFMLLNFMFDWLGKFARGMLRNKLMTLMAWVLLGGFGTLPFGRKLMELFKFQFEKNARNYDLLDRFMLGGVAGMLGISPSFIVPTVLKGIPLPSVNPFRSIDIIGNQIGFAAKSYEKYGIVGAAGYLPLAGGQYILRGQARLKDGFKDNKKIIYRPRTNYEKLLVGAGLNPFEVNEYYRTKENSK